MIHSSAHAKARQKFFNACAKGWEDRNYPPELREQVKHMLAGLGLAPGLDILDVGCGQGILLPYLRLLAGPTARLLALDASAAMLKGVASRDPFAQAVNAFAEDMPLPDACVDVAICFSAFPHFSDKAAAVREFFRVLRPGGKAYVLHVGSREFINHLHDLYEAVAGDHLPDAQGMFQLFTQAGFAKANLEEGADHWYFSASKPQTNCNP